MPINRTARAVGATLLEGTFPATELSKVVEAERRSRDTAYQAHRWFARRPPALFRGILLAASMPANTSSAEFWQAYASDEPHLQGATVFDPFMGGGTTLVEAGRLGARVAGRDIDPVSVRLVGHELDPPKPDEFEEASAALLTHLRTVMAPLYPHSGDALPLHQFSVALVTCPGCAEPGPLYSSPVLARGVNKAGSVARAEGITGFCPGCGDLRRLPVGAKELVHCGSRFPLSAGTWRGQRYTCPSCNRRSSHAELLTGAAPRWELAVEETVEGGERRFRPPTDAELRHDIVAAEMIRARALDLPRGEVPSDNADGRPGSFGMTHFQDLFTSRQLLLFAEGFRWIAEARSDDRVTRALQLGLSNALATNNRMCGYATDYGRLSALFSVRGYSLPTLSVELNALHPRAGRGTLPRTLARVAASLAPNVRRKVFASSGNKTVMHGHRLGDALKVTHGPAQESSVLDMPGEAKAKFIVTDPPYFDYIQYDSLSAFYRAWFTDDGICGSPVLPAGENPVSTFAALLGDSFRASQTALAAGGLMAFTYHSSNQEAWRALSLALEQANLRVTALWPVLADPHMGHHGTTGACQYDLVVVCRRAIDSEVSKAPAPSAELWLDSMGMSDLPAPDLQSAKHAFAALRQGWGKPTK